MRTHLVGLLMLALFTVEAALGGQIDMREVNLAVGSIIVDADVALLNGFYGTDQSSVLSYGATINQGGWNGTLQGNYLGMYMNVNYQGSEFMGTWGSGPDAFIRPTMSTCIHTNSTGDFGSYINGWKSDGFWVYKNPNLKAKLTATGVKL